MIDGCGGRHKPTPSGPESAVARIPATKFFDIQSAIMITPVDTIFCELTTHSKGVSESKVA